MFIVRRLTKVLAACVLMTEPAWAADVVFHGLSWGATPADVRRATWIPPPEVSPATTTVPSGFHTRPCEAVSLIDG